MAANLGSGSARYFLHPVAKCFLSVDLHREASSTYPGYIQVIWLYNALQLWLSGKKMFVINLLSQPRFSHSSYEHLHMNRAVLVSDDQLQTWKSTVARFKNSKYEYLEQYKSIEATFNTFAAGKARKKSWQQIADCV